MASAFHESEYPEYLQYDADFASASSDAQTARSQWPISAVDSTMRAGMDWWPPIASTSTGGGAQAYNQAAPFAPNSFAMLQPYRAADIPITTAPPPPVSTAPPLDAAAKKPRKQTALACNACKHRRIRCEKPMGHDLCFGCAKKGIACVFEASTAPRKQRTGKRIEEAKAALGTADQQQTRANSSESPTDSGLSFQSPEANLGTKEMTRQLNGLLLDDVRRSPAPHSSRSISISAT